MIIPYNTDAPLYHFPYVTIGLIVVNWLVFALTGQCDPEIVAPWILEFGNGLHPLQWISNSFLHADFMHLLGNMFFLWGFGLVVEGKLGWWRMILVYLSIGLISGGIVQIAMLGSEGGALGASDVIFGLMVIALIWAPKNELSCFAWIVRPFLFECSIVIFATCFVILQIVMAAFSGFAMSSEVLHLVGALIGAAYGVALLKLDIVDCEGWDVFAVWKGTEGQGQKRPVPERDLPRFAPPPSPAQVKKISFDIQDLLAKGEVAEAAEMYSTQRKKSPEWQLEESILLALIQALVEKKLWTASIPTMVDYLRQHPDRSTRIRLKLAQILIAVEKRPMKAKAVLAKLDPQKLPADLQAMWHKLHHHADAIAEDCELEMADGEDW